MNRFKPSSCNSVFFMILSFAALQAFFNIFFLKVGVKWRRRLWNSNKNIELSVFNLKWFFLFRLAMVIFTTLFPHWPTLWNSTLKKTTLFRRCLTLLTSALNYKMLFQRWFKVVPRRDVISTKRQRWNNVEMFAGFHTWPTQL